MIKTFEEYKSHESQTDDEYLDNILDKISYDGGGQKTFRFKGTKFRVINKLGLWKVINLDKSRPGKNFFNTTGSLKDAIDMVKSMAKH